MNTDDVPTRLGKLGKVLKNEMGRISSGKKCTTNALNLRMAGLSLDDPDNEILVELEEVKLALNLEADKEELFWEKQGRENWLLFGG